MIASQNTKDGELKKSHNFVGSIVNKMSHELLVYFFIYDHSRLLKVLKFHSIRQTTARLELL